MPKVPKVNDRIGPYQLTCKLGEGGFGEVWLAQDAGESNPRQVAVKIPLKTDIDLDALLQEATLWARATGHRNVLGFLAARVFDGHIVLVSEYAPDGSLKDWLELHGGRAPSVAAAVEMTLGILAGLEHLHARNIIHRDIKPDNVLLLDQTPRLADFGISRVLKSTHRSSVTAGTPPYMAPEAFNRIRNQQTDLWSVGVILYQMLSGRLPFEGEDIAELYGAVRNETPKPLPAEVPAWLRQAVAKALAKEPSLRFQTAEEMRATLTTRMLTLLEEKFPLLSERRTLDTIPQPLERETTAIARPLPLPEPEIVEPKPLAEPVPAIKSHRLLKWSLGLTAALALTVFLLIRVSHLWKRDFTENLNGVNLEMVFVPGGEFQMGSSEEEQKRFKNKGEDLDEGPQHRVLTPAFFLGKYEITQAQWKVLMGNNPSKRKGDDLPVESVSWNDARAFCQKLSSMTGKAYRLPSEAEWEYACRAGSTEAYAGELDAMAWYAENSEGQTHPVGRKQPNAFKLHDLHGNVWEWCEDAYHDSYGGRNGNPPDDGSAWVKAKDQRLRILRGGAWDRDANHARSANRGRWLESEQGASYGFRVAVSARSR